MNRTVFSLPEHFEYATRAGLLVKRSVEHFSGGASRLDGLIDLLDRRRGVVLSSGTTVPGRYESFDLGFSDPPLVLETCGVDSARRGADCLRGRRAARAQRRDHRKDRLSSAGHVVRGDAPVEEDQRT